MFQGYNETYNDFVVFYQLKKSLKTKLSYRPNPESDFNFFM